MIRPPPRSKRTDPPFPAPALVRSMLAAARRLGDIRPVDVRTTFLGAHALPPEFQGDPEAYIAFVCEEMIPAVAAAGLADAVDGFCEDIGFTPAQIRRVFEAARRFGLPVKLHAEQLSNLHGAEIGRTACRERVCQYVSI